ncbi:hypothetical protein CDAR_480791 [Caerostris darwini]|uniref:Uncharacterized protein n=1 Tax=Caerostris darwini TaxID=1538125 RepID=A0AAV4S498_9ARAC|nr:hypothetical protein CDAR_480791 [Caerostris darwini]
MEMRVDRDGVRAELGGKASPVIGAWTVGSIFCDPVGDIHTFYRGLGKGGRTRRGRSSSLATAQDKKLIPSPTSFFSCSSGPAPRVKVERNFALLMTALTLFNREARIRKLPVLDFSRETS